MFTFFRENMKWNMLLLWKIEKQVNQGNIHPQLGRKIKNAIKQKTENKEAKKKEKKWYKKTKQIATLPAAEKWNPNAKQFFHCNYYYCYYYYYHYHHHYYCYHHCYYYHHQPFVNRLSYFESKYFILRKTNLRVVKVPIQTKAFKLLHLKIP